MAAPDTLPALSALRHVPRGDVVAAGPALLHAQTFARAEGVAIARAAVAEAGRAAVLAPGAVAGGHQTGLVGLDHDLSHLVLGQPPAVPAFQGLPSILIQPNAGFPRPVAGHDDGSAVARDHDVFGRGVDHRERLRQQQHITVGNGSRFIRVDEQRFDLRLPRLDELLELPLNNRRACLGGHVAPVLVHGQRIQALGESGVGIRHHPIHSLTVNDAAGVRVMKERFSLVRRQRQLLGDLRRDERAVSQRNHQRDLPLLRHKLDVRQHGRGHLEDTSEVFE